MTAGGANEPLTAEHVLRTMDAVESWHYAIDVEAPALGWSRDTTDFDRVEWSGECPLCGGHGSFVLTWTGTTYSCARGCHRDEIRRCVDHAVVRHHEAERLRFVGDDVAALEALNR